MELNQTEILIFAIVWAAGFGIIIWLFKKISTKRDRGKKERDRD